MIGAIFIDAAALLAHNYRTKGHTTHTVMPPKKLQPLYRPATGLRLSPASPHETYG
jgi:hypothetical protein